MVFSTPFMWTNIRPTKTHICTTSVLRCSSGCCSPGISDTIEDYCQDLYGSRAASWKRAGEVDFIAANTPIDEFKKEFIFTDTYYGFYDAIITHGDIKGKVRLEDLGGKEVLVAVDWPEEFILREQYPDIKVVTVESTLEGVTKVAFKEYDYLFAYFPTASHLIREQALPGLRVAGLGRDIVGDAAVPQRFGDATQSGSKSVGQPYGRGTPRY